MKTMLWNTLVLWSAMLLMAMAVNSDEFGWGQIGMMFAAWTQIFVTQIDTATTTKPPTLTP